MTESGEELLTILKRIKERVKTGTSDYSSLYKMLIVRADMEDKYTQMLQQAYPENFNQNDQLVKLYTEDLKNEVETRKKFVEELRTQVIAPMKIFMTTLHEEEKQISTAIDKHSSKLKKSCESVDKAKKNLEDVQTKVAQAPPQKKESIQKKEKKATQELLQKQEKANTVFVSIQQNEMPTMHIKFSEFDTKCMEKMQSNIKDFQNIKVNLSKKMTDQVMFVMTQLDAFDGRGQSERYVSRVFDAKLQDSDLSDKALVGAIAISDYRSEEPSDLSFSRGDKIKIISQHSSGWWIGEFDGRTGTFPETFVEVFTGKESHTPSKNEPVGAVFLVKTDYTPPPRSGELSLLMGDLVYVDYLTRGRCSGTNLRTRKRGFFPMSIITESVEDYPFMAEIAELQLELTKEEAQLL